MSRGSNLEALCQAIRKEQAPVEIAFTVVTRRSAPVHEVCSANNVPAVFISTTDMVKFERELLNKIWENHVNLLVLSGFMKQLSGLFIMRVGIPILNIHPALLPRHGGKGMYGMKVHQAVFEANEKVSGATVHRVDAQYDHGRILAQQEVSLAGCLSPEEIASRVLAVEHSLYPKTIIRFVQEKHHR